MQENLLHIIEKCRKNDRKAQKALYDQYSGLFYSIALRYMKKEMEAEDVLVMGFHKIFSNINKYTGEGSFEGWMKRIIVNEALMQLRKKDSLQNAVEISEVEMPDDDDILADMAYREIIVLLDKLPMGYRTIFNLYVIEGYKHREIAEELGISINTSKSQLILAKKKLQELIRQQENLK